MYTVNAWWAGHIVCKAQKETIKEVDKIIKNWREEVTRKQVTLYTCGVEMIVSSLCIDVYENGEYLPDFR